MEASLLTETLMIYLIAINIVAFIVYGADKIKAMSGKWRISEFALILFAAIGGCFGAFVGMRIWHHKTKKLRFQVLIPLFMMLWTVLILRYFGII